MVSESSHHGRLSQLVRARPVTVFFLLTFAYTWSVWGVAYFVAGPDASTVWTIPGIWGPLIAGAIVTYAGDWSVRAWARQATNWRVGRRWYLAAIGLPILLAEASTVVYWLSGVPLAFQFDSPAAVTGFITNVLVVLVIAGGLEEFGWRGFAVPRLQAKYGALAAGLVVGVAWALWHLPFVLFGWVTGQGPLLLYMVWIVGASLVLTWLYNSTEGSVLLCMLFHAVNNAPGLFAPQSNVSGNLELLGSIADTGLWWLFALGLVAYYGSTRLSASPRSIPTGAGSHSQRRVGGDGTSSENESL